MKVKYGFENSLQGFIKWAEENNKKVWKSSPKPHPLWGTLYNFMNLVFFKAIWKSAVGVALLNFFLYCITSYRKPIVILSPLIVQWIGCQFVKKNWKILFKKFNVSMYFAQCNVQCIIYLRPRVYHWIPRGFKFPLLLICQRINDILL